MKQRTTALLLAAALALSLLATAALAAEGDPAAPAVSTVQSETAESGDASAMTQMETAQNEDGSETAGADTGEGSGETDTPVEEYIPDPVGSITFGNLNRRMHEGNLQVLSIQENIDILEEIDYVDLKEDLRIQLNDIAKMQWMMVQMGQTGTLAYEKMDQAYDAVREQFDAIKDGDMQEDNADTVRQLKNLQNQIIMAGEATYIALAAMELQEDGLERQLSALDRQLEELELRYELGHISSSTLKQARAGWAALTSGLSTLRMNLNVYKGQLELLIGADITGEISLGALPKVTQEDLDTMDLERDMETAKENSWDIYQATETVDEARKTYNNSGGDYGYNTHPGDSTYMRIRHNWNTAKYTYDNTIQSFELGLRNLYLKVMDYKQVLDAAKTALAVEQDNYAVAQLKQSQGTLSQNGLLEAEDKLKEAREKVAGAENDLFSAYNTYRWAVDYGIMN